MTKIEKAMELLAGADEDLKKNLVKEICETLEDFRTDQSNPDWKEEESAGILAAIEIIKANF